MKCYKFGTKQTAKTLLYAVKYKTRKQNSLSDFIQKYMLI